MGVYDSVIAKCPECNGEVEFQSKVGGSRLARYSITNVPDVIAADINKESSRCNGCGLEYVAIHPLLYGRVQMHIQSAET